MIQMKLRHLAEIQNSNVDKVIIEGEQPVRLCNYVDVYKNDFITAEMEFNSGSATQTEIDRFNVKVGDVIITKDSEDRHDIGVPAYVRATADDLVCGYHLTMLRAFKARADGAFLFWALQSKPAKEAFAIAANGVTRYGLTQEGIKGLPLSVPDLPTQKLIAAFLDRETAQIDELISKKERLVEVQRLRLQSSLQEMVLGGAEVQRGLGGDWLQSLSDDWRLMPLKHLVTAMGGATPSKDREDFWAGDIPWVSPKDMKTDVITDVPDHVSQAALDASAIQMVPEQAVLIVVRGMILARLVPVCRLGVTATINQDMKALLPRTKVIGGDYLQRMLQGFGDVLMSFIEEAAHGTKKLRSDALFGLKFPVPPLDQQVQIAGRYEAARASAEKIEDATRKSIDRLREYRAALITAAVTGQIDVESYGKAGAASETLDRIEEEMQV
ncbi:restriction endonuclease subunit S [Pseudosulfitobacter pseudonitzschiae]|uniref:restriction endonuclease subunit S n=1 Tax=Pseudosulfitobacter pseudonitzschiae TaxID=1402135 RepID=UPI003B7F4A0D